MNITNKDKDAFGMFLIDFEELREILEHSDSTGDPSSAPELIRRHRLINSLCWFYFGDTRADDALIATQHLISKNTKPYNHFENQSEKHKSMMKSEGFTISYSNEDSAFTIESIKYGKLIVPVEFNKMRTIPKDHPLLFQTFYAQCHRAMNENNLEPITAMNIVASIDLFSNSISIDGMPQFTK